MKQKLHLLSLFFGTAMIVAGNACSDDEGVETAFITSDIQQVSFDAFDEGTEKSVTIDANYDWSFDVTDEGGYFDVVRDPSDPNKLNITQKKTNYSKDAYKATIRVVAQESAANMAETTISLEVGANSSTYLAFADQAYAGQSIIAISMDADGTFTNPEDISTASVEVYLMTNNVLSMKWIDDQNPLAPPTDDRQDTPETRTPVEGCDWLEYEQVTELTEEELEHLGVSEGVSKVVIRGKSNTDRENGRIAHLKIYSGNENIHNDICEVDVVIMQGELKDMLITTPSEMKFEWNAVGTTQVIDVLSNAMDKIDTKLTGVNADNINRLFEVKEEDVSENIKRISLTMTAPYLGSTEGTTNYDAYYFTLNDEGEKEPDYTKLSSTTYIRCSAAPAVEFSTNKSTLAFKKDGEKKQYLTVTTNFPKEAITLECKDGSGEAADWMTAEYKDDLKAVEVTVTGDFTEEGRNGKLVIKVGTFANNQAQQTISVVQMGTNPVLIVKPTYLTFGASGGTQTITVDSNQPVTLDSSALFDGCKATYDETEGTITVEVGALQDAAMGGLSGTLTVQGGELKETVTIVQNPTYKVGDLYVINGNPVGVVYKVTDDGAHGYAFAFKVQNILNYVICNGKFGPQFGYFPYDPDMWQISGEDEDTTGYDPDAPYPNDRFDGKKNCDLIKSADPNWRNKFNALKWVEDVSQEDGVEWYIPAEKELLELAQYMCGQSIAPASIAAQLGLEPTTLTWAREDEVNKQWIANTNPSSVSFNYDPQWDNIKKRWNEIRELYKKYGGDYYIVFEESDCKEITAANLGTNDRGGTRWYSSTMVREKWNDMDPDTWQTFQWYGYRSVSVNFDYFYGDGEYWFWNFICQFQKNKNGGVTNWRECGGSTHPICKF